MIFSIFENDLFLRLLMTQLNM